MLSPGAILHENKFSAKEGKRVQHDKIKHYVIPEINSGQAQNLFQDLKNKEYTKRNMYKCFLEHASALLPLSSRKHLYIFPKKVKI